MQKFTPKLILALAVMLSACASKQHRVTAGDMESLAGLQSMANAGSRYENNGLSRPETGHIREIAIKETALSLGAQAGLAWRSKAIDEELTRNARYLTTVFDFNSLILEHNILPPVLIEGRNTFNLNDAHTIRLSDRTYKISKQARFISTAPTWRQYLWLDYKQPEKPNSTLLPKTRREKEIWCEFTEQGWKNGIEQANIILEENLSRIKEDFSGMILYRKLLAMNMVSPPFVAHTDLGITGDESEIHIDDRVLRITALPRLNLDSKAWRAALAKSENVLERFRQMEHLAKESKITITNEAWQPVIAPVNNSKRTDESIA